jgi:hypothetical protein
MSILLTLEATTYHAMCAFETTCVFQVVKNIWPQGIVALLLHLKKNVSQDQMINNLSLQNYNM